MAGTRKKPEAEASAAEPEAPVAPGDAPEPETAEQAAEVPAAAPAEEPEPAKEPEAKKPEPKPARKPRKAEPKAKAKPEPKAKQKRPAKPKARKPIVRLPKPEYARGRRQERRGVVVSDAMEKTIVVKVDTIKAHPRYKKVVRRSVKFHAHDEGNQAKVGDIVRIVETRPLSATKHWRLVEVVEAAR